MVKLLVLVLCFSYKRKYNIAVGMYEKRQEQSEICSSKLWNQVMYCFRIVAAKSGQCPFENF